MAGQPNSLFIFLKILLIFREVKGGRKRRRETSVCGCLLHAPYLGTWHAAQEYTQTENQSGDFLVSRPMLNPLSYTSQV